MDVQEDYYRLIQDDDCHWYVIRLCDVDAFTKWEDAAPYWDGYEGPDFSNHIVNGPHTVAFREYTTL